MSPLTAAWDEKWHSKALNKLHKLSITAATQSWSVMPAHAYRKWDVIVTLFVILTRIYLIMKHLQENFQLKSSDTWFDLVLFARWHSWCVSFLYPQGLTCMAAHTSKSNNKHRKKERSQGFFCFVLSSQSPSGSLVPCLLAPPTICFRL